MINNLFFELFGPFRAPHEYERDNSICNRGLLSLFFDRLGVKRDNFCEQGIHWGASGIPDLRAMGARWCVTLENEITI
jgi:hypothetical protein